jgi:bifunctional non-homologous end joining protein LigD
MAPGLGRYREMRKFDRTPEPRGADAPTGDERRYFIQRHDASHLHYDFRLELEGVLKSWAIPKGPSLDPAHRRLAVHVEDHPLEYGTFEGKIPKGNYGAGTVLLWDRGVWRAEGDAAAAYAKGNMKIHLDGEKLQGRWALVRMGGKAGNEKNWLLIKERDAFAQQTDITVDRPESVAGVTRERPKGASGGESGASPLPEIPFQLATLAAHPPRGEGWLFEIKLDGYRVMARLTGGKARLLTRGGKDWSERFPRVARALESLPVRDAIVDGEMVVLDERGVSNFSALGDALGRGDDRSIVYFPFDLLYVDGEDLRGQPLTDRKLRLAKLLATGKGPLRYLDHVLGQGTAFVRTTCELGLEGSIAKRADAPYRSGRGDSWRKLKCTNREELVIVGWTDPGGGRTAFGALLLATRQGAEKTLTYAGRVGTGFDERSLAALHARLDALARAAPPVANPPAGVEARGVHWVEPALVAEVAFTGWSPAGRLRHAVYKGLREDKPAREVVKERPAPRSKPAGVVISNPDRVIDAFSGLTKGALAAWYEEAADRLLPELVGRPLSVVRCPAGAGKVCFFQKHVGEGFPAAVRALRVEEEAGPADYISVYDVASLVSLVQMGVIELHPWSARAERIDHPDRIILDLDPDPALPWSAVVKGAQAIREHLAEFGLASFVRTTGGKGLHVVAPLTPTLGWDVVKPFCKGIAQALAREAPDKYTATIAKTKREGKIFVDYLRNGRGSTAIASWSVRARAGAPVAVPVSWEELPELEGGDHFGVAEARARIAQPDPWEGFAELRQAPRLA